MRILFDMDCILADTMGSFISWYNGTVLREGGKPMTMEQVTSFEIKDHVEHPELVSKIFKTEGFFSSLQPLPGAVEAFKRLSKRHECRVATSSYGPQSAKEKLEWCDRWLGLAYRDVIIGGKKHWIDADILIDDKPETMKQWKRVGISIAWPYNTELADITNHHAQSYLDTEAAWKSIVAFVDGL